MHSVAIISAVALTMSISIAHPLFEQQIKPSPNHSRRIPNEFLRHGASLPRVVRQSFPLSTSCTSQSDCTPEQECTLDPTIGCESGFCTGCTTNADCASGDVCFKQQFGNFCIDADLVCTTSPDCEEDQFCSKQNSDPLGFCVDRGVLCESDDDCTDPETCSLLLGANSLGICQIVCVNDSDCIEGQVCLAPTCITQCVSDADCDDTETCTFGTCIPTTTTPATSAPTTTTAVPTLSCSSDDDCPPGFECDSIFGGAEPSCLLIVCDTLANPPSVPTPTPGVPTPPVETTTPTATPAASTPAASPSPQQTSMDPAPQTDSDSPTATPAASTPAASPSPQQTSTDPAPQTDSDSPSPICVDARALSDFRSHELVFDKHALSWVLCDAQESCATAGHMVVFKGEAMMMATYCDLGGCERRSMLVNSPRYRRGLRVPSRTAGLEYTAFAARHETRVEEGVLRAAVRVGL